MKKLFISIIAGLALVSSSFATGNQGVNPPQSGVINFTTGGLVVTTTFPFAYSSQPAVIAYSINGTNNAPFVVSAVTLTNFVLTAANGATTNGSAAWASFAAYPRVYAGTNQMGANGLVTNTFSVPYVYPPVISLSDSLTNGAAACTTVTTTNFVITVTAAETVYWGALGNSYQPGLNNITY